MRSTQSIVKQSEDRVNLSELDKRVQADKKAFRGVPGWKCKGGEKAYLEDMDLPPVQDPGQTPKNKIQIPNFKFLIEYFLRLKNWFNYYWSYDKEMGK